MAVKKLDKLNLPSHLLNSKVLFVNYLVEDCTYMLKKLLGLAEGITENLKLLIIPLPPEPQSTVDTYTYYARKLCEVFALNGGQLSVLFVKNDDKQELISRVFKRDKKHFIQQTDVKVGLSMSEGTLLYAWGSANKGKLGLYPNLHSYQAHPDFYSQCRLLQGQTEEGQ
jgi:hypothetical protein